MTFSYPKVQYVRTPAIRGLGSEFIYCCLKPWPLSFNCYFYRIQISR